MTYHRFKMLFFHDFFFLHPTFSFDLSTPLCQHPFTITLKLLTTLCNEFCTLDEFDDNLHNCARRIDATPVVIRNTPFMTRSIRSVLYESVLHESHEFIQATVLYEHYTNR